MRTWRRAGPLSRGEGQGGWVFDEIGNPVKPTERPPMGEPHAGERRAVEGAAGRSEAGRGLVVRLFRAPVFDTSGEEVLEKACAGMIENEDAEMAVRREAYEELGVALNSLELVARIWSSPGVSTERQSLFLARRG